MQLIISLLTISLLGPTGLFAAKPKKVQSISTTTAHLACSAEIAKILTPTFREKQDVKYRQSFETEINKLLAQKGIIQKAKIEPPTIISNVFEKHLNVYIELKDRLKKDKHNQKKYQKNLKIALNNLAKILLVKQPTSFKYCLQARKAIIDDCKDFRSDRRLMAVCAEGPIKKTKRGFIATLEDFSYSKNIEKIVDADIALEEAIKKDDENLIRKAYAQRLNLNDLKWTILPNFIYDNTAANTNSGFTMVKELLEKNRGIINKRFNQPEKLVIAAIVNKSHNYLKLFILGKHINLSKSKLQSLARLAKQKNDLLSAQILQQAR